ncbi:bifunctional folylpolyglutamate synthase/dihydrofolate synthase [Weissella diestrammenae]|uniref:tetrahydrofolate synthase n=1 Tax=Weissella diestrammenae TaxID=1162633 RepID=A0A7G9T4A8_9LACO|nr:folylpolyglutamate synthase/dihydrofolate synthase family protein [Weissella diestrammenae]MCM0583465.1 bifunctional folylpolyglutamate synthase/dihydrofolate synthase [Weissella diestrammenae]QNN74933.1 bifunctional folylpolyglutamate synthase/dihydrofolate synthase [Weissella diestrammenae]
MIDDYPAAIALIHGRHKWQKTNTFARIAALLAQLGNPQKGLKYIHITGTNGKGSVAKMTASMLQAHGLNVGLFTSPFIMRFNERIQINGEPIPDATLTRIMQRIEPILQQMDATFTDGGPTEFETLTAAMFVYFSEQDVDVVVLEVGIGGTWDTTNIIKDKLVSVITTIGLDHQKILGQTMPEIAEQKAGIIHKNRPTIIGKLPEAAQAVIQQAAGELFVLGQDFSSSNGQIQRPWGQSFDFSDRYGEIADIFLDLMGDYQQDNAAVAIETVWVVMQALGRSINVANMREALTTVQWPARFEKVSVQPLIVLDGAHNPAGIAALSSTLQTHFSNRTIYLMVGVLADKNYPLMLHELAQISGVKLSVVGFQAPNQRESIDPHQIQIDFPELKVTTFDDWHIGVQTIISEMDLAQDMIVVSGSLYFVSEIRTWLMQKK